MITSKPVRTEQEIITSAHILRILSFLMFVGAIASELILALSTHWSMFYVGLLSMLVLTTLACWSAAKANGMTFVDGDEMMELSYAAERFLDVRESFCKIVTVRPFLTTVEYAAMKAKIRTSTKTHEADSWKLMRAGVCS